uniref:G kinase-anchoring protein 1 isoform X2 n=1 Tax=Myxine glutinosa TaxID=7769 RepID=UPI00358F25C9
MSLFPVVQTRFAVLRIESSSSDDDDVHKDGRGNNKAKRRPDGRVQRQAKQQQSQKKEQKQQGGAATAGDGKKTKKKKGREEQEQLNQLRSLAFMKTPARSSNPPPAPDCNVGVKTLKNQNEGKTQSDEQFEVDLKQAMVLSQLEYAMKQTPVTTSCKTDGAATAVEKPPLNRKERQKKQVATVAQSNEASPGELRDAGRPQKCIGSLGTGVDPTNEESKTIAAPFPVIAQANHITLDAHKARAFPNGLPQLPPNRESDTVECVRLEQLKAEMEAKSAEVAVLHKDVGTWQTKYKEVKKRNAQLLFMLQQGEMKEKSDVLLQVEELTNIKNELTQQVINLHAALEQERTKVKALHAELLKYQLHRLQFSASYTDFSFPPATPTSFKPGTPISVRTCQSDLRTWSSRLEV